MGCLSYPPGRAGKRAEPEANRGMTLGKLDAGKPHVQFDEGRKSVICG